MENGIGRSSLFLLPWWREPNCLIKSVYGQRERHKDGGRKRHEQMGSHRARLKPLAPGAREPSPQENAVSAYRHHPLAQDDTAIALRAFNEVNEIESARFYPRGSATPKPDLHISYQCALDIDLPGLWPRFLRSVRGTRLIATLLPNFPSLQTSALGYPIVWEIIGTALCMVAYSSCR